MKFKRLLTVGLMALLCAGTATAASRLNSVQVTPSVNAATVVLRTTGSFAHQEYRPDDHLVLVDLTGVSADSAVERTAALSSAVLKGYKLSSYTSASGSEVTRIEMVVGDGVNVEVNDKSDGLQIVLRGNAASKPSASLSPAASPANQVASSSASPLTKITPAPLQPVAARPAPASAVAPLKAEVSSPASPAGTPITIRSVSVQRGHGALDVVIEGPSAAQPFLLKNPDRLVVDFNAVLGPSVKNIGVHTKDVLEVRVGRFKAEPPVTRIVIDLSGPRAYEVVPSAKQVIVRVKTEDTAMAVPPVKATPSPASVPASAFAFANASAVAGQTNRGGSSVQKADIVNTAPASAPAKPQAGVAALPPASSTPRTQTPQAQTLQPKNPQIHDSVQKADVVNTAPSIASVKPKAEVAALPAVSSTPQPQAPQPQPQVRDEQAHGVQKAYVVSAVPDASARPQAAVTAVPAPSSNLVASSTPSNTPVASTPAANSTLIASAPVVHDQQMSDPRVRAGAAAETMATSPAVGQAPAEVARLNPQASGQVSGNAAPVAPAAQKYTGEPISVNLKDVDLKDFFRLIHEISGLNIVLDPNVRGTVTLVLDDVPWDQALDIVLKNNSLDRELQGNVLRIAATDTLRKEAVDRRAQSEAVALAVDRQTITRFLSYAKAKETVPTIKKFLTARGDIISDDRTNALIISDIPSVLPNIDHLISQLDRKSQEVEIEVRVVSATRSFSRDLGVQLGFNWGNGVSTIGGTNPNGASGGTTGPLSTIPLFTNLPAAGPTTGFSLSNITKNYGIDAILTAAETHNLAKVLSRPRIVTQSNVKAEVKQGVKIPVYTTPTGNTNSSVSYVDAVLRLSVLPQITADNTIFLTVDVENTQPAGTAAGGNYILTTQQATTQVLVTDGGTVVIGGVIQTTNSVSTSQTPILGNIPWLGNLFKERLVKTETDELIFFITPKIIQT